jgi:hypothetical protein
MTKDNRWLRAAAAPERRWYAYALAGAGTIAAAPSAHATVIYTAASVNSTATCSLGVGGSCGSMVNGFNILVDLNGDSVNDFSLQAGVSQSTAYLHFAGFDADVLQQTGIGTVAFTSGQSIGPATAPLTTYASPNYLTPSSVWGNGDQFLGLRLVVGPNTYYGWAELASTFNGSNVYSVTLEGYAYDDSGAPIAAGYTGIIPEPGTAGLVLLALGSGGLLAWRKRKQALKAA